MKISSAFKIFSKKLGRASGLGGSYTSFNFNFIFGGILVFTIFAELITAYNSLYQNLIFSDQMQTVRSANVTRINTENYNLVKARLDAVENYNSTSTIDFMGSDPKIGRANPFADPE
jgi:hypothetical protein